MHASRATASFSSSGSTGAQRCDQDLISFWLCQLFEATKAAKAVMTKSQCCPRNAPDYAGREAKRPKSQRCIANSAKSGHVVAGWETIWSRISQWAKQLRDCFVAVTGRKGTVSSTLCTCATGPCFVPMRALLLYFPAAGSILLALPVGLAQHPGRFV